MLNHKLFNLLMSQLHLLKFYFPSDAIKWCNLDLSLYSVEIANANNGELKSLQGFIASFRSVSRVYGAIKNLVIL